MNFSRLVLFTVVSVGLLSLSSVAFAQPATAKAPESVRPMPRVDRWMTRHNGFNKRIKQGNVDLIFIGDSITHFWENAGKNVWQKYYAKRNAVNLGIGGDRTQHVLWRLDNGNIDGISPKLAVMMIGTNNSVGRHPENIAAGITAIVKKLRTKLPKTKILLLAIFPRGPNKDDALRKVNAATNAIVKDLDDADMVHYLDIGPKFLEADGKLTRKIMPDLLHLSPGGYQIWADAIEPSVKKLTGEK